MARRPAGGVVDREGLAATRPAEGGSPGEESPDEDREEDGLARLLGLWRSEVLKLLLERGQAAEAAAEDTRRLRHELGGERESRGRAEEDAKVSVVVVNGG